MNKEVMYIFKDTLIRNNDTFHSWKEIHSIVESYLLYYLKWDFKNIPTKEQLRQVYFKELQKDNVFIAEYGIPITKNSVGVKLSKDRKEIEHYIKSETKRALSLFVKLKPIKYQLAKLDNAVIFDDEELLRQLEELHQGGEENEE